MTERAYMNIVESLDFSKTDSMNAPLEEADKAAKKALTELEKDASPGAVAAYTQAHNHLQAMINVITNHASASRKVVESSMGTLR